MTEAGPCVRGGDCSGAGSSLSLSLFWSGGESPLEEGDEDDSYPVSEEPRSKPGVWFCGFLFCIIIGSCFFSSFFGLFVRFCKTFLSLSIFVACSGEMNG